MSRMSNDSYSHYKESNYYDQKVVDELQENLKNGMNEICDKYGFNHDLVRLLVELEFDLDRYCKLKVNGMMHSYDFHR